MIPVSVNIAVIVALAAIEAAIVIPPFCRDIHRAGGVRALYAELTGTASPSVPAPQPAPAPVPWWQDQRPGFAKQRPANACWEPANRPEVAGVPPWHPDAASLTTGYTRWHAQSLKELLERGMS